MTSISKLVLGTVQFGMKYGVNNSAWKPASLEIQALVSSAKTNGVQMIDTADSYGDSQEELSKCDLSEIGVMSKFVLTEGVSFKACLKNSLSRLKIDSLFSYSFHRAQQLTVFKNWAEVDALKQKGVLKKIGVSVYSNQELETAAQHPQIDLIQVPFNLLDNYHSRKKGLELAARNNKIVHVRSVFLQGLFFMSAAKMTGKISALIPVVEEIQALAKESKISVEEMCLSYVLSKPEIQGVVIGVDSLEQLKQNIAAFSGPDLPSSLIKEIENLRVPDGDLLNPKNWEPT